MTVRAVDNNSNDVSHTSNITLNPASTGDSVYNGLSNKTVSVTVTDNDTPNLAVAQSGGSTAVSESGTEDTFTVALTTQPTGAVTVTVSRPSADATECEVKSGSGSYGASTTLSFSTTTWNAAQTVTVRGRDDDLDDDDQDCVLTLDPASAADSNYNGLSSVTVTATVADDDTAGVTVVESGGSTVVSEPQTTDSFTVALRTQPTADVTVTATRDADAATECELRVGAGAYGVSAQMTFTPSTAGTLWSLARTVSVRAIDDNDLDGPQDCDISFALSSTDSDYHQLSVNDVEAEVRDNEAPTVTLSLSPSTISENGGRSTVTARLDRAVSEETRVTVSAAAGTGATAGDFRLSGTRLTIAANATASTGEVTIAAADDRVDGPELKRVTVSGTASGGQGAGAPSDVTLTIEDDEDAPTVTLSAADAAIWEDGGTTTVSARLSHASSGTTTVRVLPVAGVYAVGADATLTIPAGATASSNRATLTAVDNQERSDADRTVTILHDMLSNSRGAEGIGELTAGRLTVWDDETASVSLLLEPSRVSEGGTARVSARMDGNRPARAAVTLTVSAAAGPGATAASFALGPERTLTVAAGARTSAGSVEIEAVDDEVDAPDRQVTVTAAVGAGSRARRPEAVTLTIADDDETPRAVLVLTPAAIDESGELNAAAVTATLERASSEATTIEVSASGTGFRQRGTALTVAAGSTSSAGTVTLTAVDDEERNADREVRVSGRAANAHGIGQPAAVVLTIRDDDGTEEVTAVLLPAAARAMADSRAAAVRRRLEGADAAGATELPALTGLLERHGPSAQERGLDWKRNLLPRASFALPLDDEDGGGGGITVWGGGDYADLDGEARGVKWDGEVASAHLGADRRLANGLRLGLAASWSEATFDYEHRRRKGEWKLEMASAQPYLGWTTPGGTLLWASAGYGSGELDLDRGGGAAQTADADMRLAAAGARGPVYASAGLEVSLRGEALYAKLEVDDNGDDIRGHESEATRLRLAVEARRERVLASGARLSPRFELGARHDGGDGETGSGAEVGAGVDYASGRLGLSAGARALVANSDYDEWGADLALAYAAGADGRGLAFRLMPSWGAADSGTEELWARGAPGLGEAGGAAGPEAGARVEAELGYGLKSPLGRGLLRLAAGGEWGEDAGSVCRLSGTVALDAAATLGLELELREPRSGDAERSLMLKAELKF